MMWRGAVFSSLLHGGLLIGLVGTLPILPRIFDRTPDTASTELQISVDVVSAGALKNTADTAGLRDTAPDPETAAPPPKLSIGRSAPNPSTPPASTDPDRAPENATVTPPSSVALVTPPAVKRDQPSQKPSNQERRSAERQSAEPAAADNGQRTAAISVVIEGSPSPAPPETDTSKAGQPQKSETSALPRREDRSQTASTSRARTAPDRAGSPSREDTEKTSPEALERVFLNAVSGRKRDLIAEVLDGDTRIRRALAQQPDTADIPEKARARTLARLNKAAQAGFPHAQYNLAGTFLRGDIVPRDMAAAQKWLTRAAEQGYAPAQSLLALMRLTGKGKGQNGEPDAAEAAFWWSLAAEADNPGAKVATRRLRPLLRPQEHSRAARLRARWGSLITDLSDLTSGENSRRDLDRALQTAAEKGDLDAVLSLLARGADADESGDAGRNAVINAAWRGRQRIIQLLLERGVATELPDDDGRTPLIWAAINGHDTIVSDLVTSGANPNKRDRNGTTALIRAAWNGHTSVVSQLIGADADVNARDDNGMTALDHARRERNSAVIRLLEGAGAR